jgi:hypothetical protein
MRHFKKKYCAVHSALDDGFFFPWITMQCTVTIIYMTIFYGFVCVCVCGYSNNL